ncbi:hypothetical protein [Nocardia sp. NPDC024068]|uniref:MmyB family transcriptional regulator n=1 Tax=Nocardia sp. NPDC024068 TaxID=3157197 RepID=UPI0033DB41AD
MNSVAAARTPFAGFEELEAESPEFPGLWARHDVRPETHETKLLRHPTRRLPTIDFHAFEVTDVPGYQLLVYRGEPRRQLSAAGPAGAGVRRPGTISPLDRITQW